jgi:elongation factor Ts
MIKITASEVNKLRQATGAGMMDCKKALQESNGDYDAAMYYLRKKGQKISDLRADKEAKEGVVIAKTNDSKTFASVVMVNCETDFVAKNEEFIKFVNSISEKSIETKSKSIDELNGHTIGGSSIDDLLADMIGKVGEKIQISQYKYVEAPIVFAYIHLANKIGSIVGLNKSDIDGIDEVGKGISMQVAAISTSYLDQDCNPKDVIDRELEFGREQSRQEGRPENLIEKIAIGKLNKFYKENTLLGQEFIKDNKKTVKQYLQDFNKELAITEFCRLSLV